MMTTRRLFVFIFVIALFAIAVRETLDPDMWWHLRTGQIIFTEGIPRQDIFSFTVPDFEWITHEWLSQVLMWLIFAAAGLPGLMVTFALLTAVTYLLLYAACEGRPFLAAFVVLLAAITSAIVWGARPQIFNLFFTALFVFLIEKVRRGGFSFRVLWLLPPLTMLWANLHSGYLLGVVFLGTIATGELLGRWRRAPQADFSWLQIRRLFLITFLSFLAAGLNANGPALWIYPFLTLGSSAMQTYILEWHSPNFHELHFWPFALMVSLTALSWVWSKRPPTFTEWLLYFGTGAAGLISARNIPLFATIMTPILARHLTLALRGVREVDDPTPAEDYLRRLTVLLDPAPASAPPRPLAAINWVLALLVLAAALGWTAQKIGGNETAVTAAYPVAAVDFLQETELASSRGFNSYNWGGYLIWRGLPVFVDGRADVYGDSFLFEYRRTFDLKPDWQAPLQQYAVDYVLMEQGSQLALLLEESPEWRPIYTDGQAQIFVPDNAGNHVD